MESYADIVRRCREAEYYTVLTEYYGWDLAESLEYVEQMEFIDELRIPGLSDEEADEFWHAVNDA